MVRLPLFRELVENVYRRLGESWLHDPAERAGMEQGGELYGQYDRVLRCLERRLSASELPRNRGMKTRIRDAVKIELSAPEDVDLSHHLALMELSRDSEGTSRLLTTNFDTLFEHAWLTKNMGLASSHAGMALPRPMTSTFSGVLHLHGRLEDVRVQTTETDLILTSAEFGEAYLRSGWASRYLYDLARTHTLVLVGYQADDPPMRYLLEALEADRELYPDIRKVYAFGEYTNNDREKVEALWRAKGVEPVLYLAENHDHSKLYDTLQEWKRYQDDPTAWRRGQLEALLNTDPLPSSEAAIARCVELLGRADASQLVGDLSPEAAWLPILMEQRVFKQLPAVWIASRVDDQEMIRACAGLDALDDTTRWRVKLSLDRKGEEVSPARRQAWRLLLDRRTSAPHALGDGGWHEWEPLIRNGATGFQARELIASILVPRVKVRRPIYFERDGEQPPETLHRLLTVELEPAEHPRASEILKSWPDTREASKSLFEELDRNLEQALMRAEELGQTGDWDSPSRDVPSIARHPQNRNHYGFRPIVQSITELWLRMTRHEGALAKAAVEHWARSRFILSRRMFLFAVKEPLWTTSEAARIILDLEDHIFWDSEAQVEIMRLLVARWAEFDVDDRQALEARLRTGVPAELYAGNNVREAKEWSSIVDHSIYRRLTRIRAAGGLLSDASLALLEAIGERHPRWAPSPDDQDDFSAWQTERIGFDGHPDLLAQVEDAQLVQQAFRLQDERRFDEGDLWRVFCKADPERALRGLKLDGDAGRWEVEAWRYFLWAAAEQDQMEFQHEVAAALLLMPPETLREVIHAASSWMARQHASLAQAGADGAQRFLQIWDHIAEEAFRELPEEDGTFGGDVISESLNGPGGDMAAGLLAALNETKPEEGQGLGDLEPRFQRLVQAGSRAGMLARVCVTQDLAFLDAVAPDWTHQHLVPRLGWDHAEALHLWAAYAHSRIGKPRLFNALKPAMLQAFEGKPISKDALNGLFSKLLEVAFLHRHRRGEDYVLSAAEIKRALTVAPGRVRQSVAWHLWRRMSDGKIIDKAVHWRDLIKPVLIDIWPLDARTRERASSQKLVLMALECGDAFPDAVDTISDLIVPYELYGIDHGLRLEQQHQNVFLAHPRAFVRLVNKLVDPDQFPVPDDLPKFLQDCLHLDADIVDDPAYIRLYGLRRRLNA